MNADRTIPTPTAECRFGFQRCDITPPVGIYHRFWGAAKHDVATGVHRPLTATALVFGSNDADDSSQIVVIATDHCLFRPEDMHNMLDRVSDQAGVPRQQLLFQFAHTHSGGHVVSQRADQPGGELIGPYLDMVAERVAVAVRHAVDSIDRCVMTVSESVCNMANQRDDWDTEIGRHVCGFQPDGKSDYPVKTVRITGENGQTVMTLVNYPCHPTTLAWDNTLISPDYVGALRETVEQSTGAPCTFLLAPCGDVGPRYGYVGDTAVADQNGRQVGFAALSALESAAPAAHDYHYAGAVISGATLGAWEYRPHHDNRQNQTARFRIHTWQIPLAYLAGQPTVAEVRQQIDELQIQEAEQRTAGHLDKAAETRAVIERRRRFVERIHTLPTGDTYPYPITVMQTGDIFWVAVEGEPYFQMQTHLESAFPHRKVIVMPLANGAETSYLVPRDCYHKPLYQAEVAILEAGCLEAITAAVIEQLAKFDESD